MPLIDRLCTAAHHFLVRLRPASIAILAATSICATALHAQPAFTPIVREGAERLPKPTPVQAAWHDLEVGMFIHLAPQTWQDSERDTGKTPLADINPDQLDVDQWVRVAKSMGAKYIVFVAKHEGGFCWWPTQTTNYSVRGIPWKGGEGDLLNMLAGACRDANMKLGVYISPRDNHHKADVGGRCADPELQRRYEKLFREQLLEILTNYGSMMEVWFDGSLVFDVGDILAACARDAVIFQGPQATIRWVGNEEGFAPYPAWNGAKFDPKSWGTLTASDGTPDGDRWLPNECDARLRNTWFWRTDNEQTIKSLADLVTMYEKSVGRGGVLLLNHTPDRTGRIPEADEARTAEFGAEIERLYATPAASVSGEGSELSVQPSAPITIDRVVIQEDITKGERVRTYTVEGLVAGVWKPLARGTAIGHKRIERFPPQRVEAVRLRVPESVGVPAIRMLAIYAADRPATK